MNKITLICAVAAAFFSGLAIGFNGGTHIEIPVFVSVGCLGAAGMFFGLANTFHKKQKIKQQNETTTR